MKTIADVSEHCKVWVIKPEHEAVLEEIELTSQGLIGLCGTTGSGKSTTQRVLAGRWLARNNFQVSLMTQEAPIEGLILGGVQCAVDTDNLSFHQAGEAWAGGVVMNMRLDPDGLYTGESRDYASAYAALETAISGHPGWFGIHCTYPLDALNRMRNWGIDARELANPTYFRGLIAQTLVNTLCPSCALPWSDALKRQLIPLRIRHWPDACLLRMSLRNYVFVTLTAVLSAPNPYWELRLIRGLAVEPSSLKSCGPTVIS
ncbi:ATPase, T2SS/T4P/T4SS family [Pectobacterium cacticida]|uniref:ATPase, T2SS/T4P/T4SS family n=1 Tax=Pectobacterium cacticida TaxID=69221 RepID=UPI0035E5E00B